MTLIWPLLVRPLVVMVPLTVKLPPLVATVVPASFVNVKAPVIVD